MVALKSVVQEALRVGQRLVAIFVDAEKAYDNVSRPILWETLPLYGFGPKTIAMLQALYADQMWVRVDGELCGGGFHSTRGVRQGCVLSPLLFNVLLDRALRAVLPQMRGVTLQDEENKEWELKVMAYADDIASMRNRRQTRNTTWICWQEGWRQLDYRFLLRRPSPWCGIAKGT